MGGGDKQASSNCKITSIHKSSSAPGRFLQLMNMSLMDSMIQMRLEGIFSRASWFFFNLNYAIVLIFD